MNRLVLTLAACCACGDNASDHAVDAATGDGASTGFPATLVVSPASQVVPLPFDLVASGGANAPLGAIALTHDVGTVGVPAASSATAFTYVTVPFGAYTLYQGVGVTPSSWDVFWLYCQGPSVSYVYDEGVGGAALFGVPATGSCQDQVAAVNAMVALPAFSIAAPKPLAGYSVDGPDIAIATTGIGTVTLHGRTLPLLVFQDVDCTTTCGTPGWYELHSVVWDAETSRAVFVIVYLSTDQHASVELTYARSLPDLGDPVGDLHLPATWTAHPAARRPAWLGMPPPRARAF